MKMRINKKKTTTAVITAIMALTATVPLPDISSLTESDTAIIQQMKASAASGRAYNQKENKWKSYTYTKWAKSGNSLYTSGCMIFSFANAIYNLNGNWVDVPNVANWACNNGSWKPGAGGGLRNEFYNKIESVYGKTYNFKLSGKHSGNVEDSKLINHLKNGGVATAHVPNHFIAIVGYNSSNKTYHVIESAVSSGGRNLKADSWVSASKLKSGSTKVDWFCLISKTGNNNNNNNNNNTNKNNSNTNNSTCFSKYTGSSRSIVIALNAIGVNSSFDYRKKIASANGISNYTGTASQNNTLISKLRAGTLKKPGASKSYFKKYTGSSSSIVTALNTIGVNSSFDYRKKIASANGVSNYTGTAPQNNTLIKKLKAGQLIKP